MPSSTCGKLLQPRKHTPSEKIRDNLSKATKTIVKRVPKGKFIHPDNTLEEVHESDPEPIEPIPQPIVDVSSVKFTLSWSILLDGVEIDSDSDLLILGECNYRDFNANAIKTMTRATTKAKVDFEYIKGSATLGAKGVTRAAERPLTINDEEGWKKAESFVESFMHEKKKDVVLTLALKYAKVCDDDDEEMDVEKPMKNKGNKVHLHLLQN